jgi:uncharacterized alpha-E superfamily protein
VIAAGTDEQLEICRKEIECDPRAWIAQELVQLSSHPTFIDGRLEPRHVDYGLRARRRSHHSDSHGGSRASRWRGSFVVNSSQGGGSKDTWVLAGPEAADALAARRGPVLGRAHLERAEDTARLLDVTYHGLLEGGGSDAPMALQEVLDALQLSGAFRSRHRKVTAEALVQFLVLDESHSSSIAAAISRARENARNVREHLSTELWEALNSTYLELRAEGRAEELAAHPHEFYRRVRSRCQLVAGAASETMARRDAWRFLLLGRLVERAEMTCRLLRVRAPRTNGDGSDDIHYWLVMLNAVSALESYARRFGAEVTPARVLEYLVLAPDFPRSVLFCLRGIEGGVAAPAVRRALSRIRAELEYQDVGELLDRGAANALERTRRGIAEISERIEGCYFANGPIPERHVYEAV